MFRKIDLHVHTPASSCYEDHINPELGLQTKPEDIIRAAIAAGLDAIAVTDHNTTEGVEPVRRAAKGTHVAVFPGIELTVRGGHLLAVFDPQTPVDVLQRLLDTLGFTQDHYSKGFTGTSMLMDEACRAVSESGGLAIAAHADRYPRGFLASEESAADKRRIHECSYLAALEITNSADRALWTEGRSPGYPKRYACLQGSDAHSPGEVGRRWSYVKMPSMTLDGLKSGLSENGDCIRFPGEEDVYRVVWPLGPKREPY